MQSLTGTLLQAPASDECIITPKAVVRIGDDGKFSEVTSDKAAGNVDVGDEGCWIIPGFIDAHLHLPQWDRRGIDGFPLMEWFDQIVYPAEARFKDAAFAEKLAEQFVTGLIRCGTTTVASFGSPFAEATDRAFQVFERRGFRAIYGMILNDMNCPKGLCQDTDESLDQSRELAAKWDGAGDGRLSYAFSPRTAMFCSEKQMRGAAALAEMVGCYIQTHVAESVTGFEQVRERFPDQIDEVEVFQEMGLLTSKTLLGHGVHLHQHHRKQMVESQTTVIHCPTANLFLESGLMDYVAHRAAGVQIALGSGVAGGPDPFMPRVAADCLNTAKAVRVHGIPRGGAPAPTPTEAWWTLTRGAAEALSLEENIGLIEPGFAADCLVVRPEPWIAELPADEKISALLYTLRPDQIEHVFIAGKRVGP